MSYFLGIFSIKLQSRPEHEFMTQPFAHTLFVSARRAVVKQKCTLAKLSITSIRCQCDGDQRRTFVLLNSMMGRTLDPVMPASSSDDELASRFSNFFSEKITRIRSEIDAAVVDGEFSVDFPFILLGLSPSLISDW